MRWQFFYALEIKFFLINSYGNFSYLIKVNLGFFVLGREAILI